MTDRDDRADAGDVGASSLDAHLVDEAPVAIVVARRDGSVRFANTAGREALPDGETLPPLWVNGVARLPNGTHRMEGRDPRTGRVWDMHLDADEHEVRAWGVDVSHRQAIDGRRRRTEQLVDASPVGLFVEDATGTTTFVNPRFRDLTGRGADVLRAEGWRTAVHEADREVVDRLWTVAVHARRAFRAEVRFRHVDGTIVSGYVEAVPERPRDDQPPSYLGTVTDVSYRRRIEDALRASQERYRRLLEGSHDLIQCVDADERLLFVNDAWLHRLGHAEKALQSLTLADIVAPESLDAFRAASRATREAGRVVEVEGCLTDVDGGRVWVEGRVASIELDNGRIDTHAFLRDVTERREAVRALADERARLARRVDVRTAQLSAASAELTRSSRMRDEFVAAVSHELRTPLHAILALAEALEDGAYGALEDRPATAVGTIVESGRHLLGLINEVLDLSRIEAGKLDIDPQLHSVCELAQASVRMIAPTAADANVTLGVRCDLDNDGLRVDGRRLRQILVNLLGNAVKFTAAGGQASLDVSVVAGGDVVRFAVRDTGCGIEPDRIRDVFEPFVQLEGGNTRRWDGTGLGLTLVVRIAALLGGGVCVESTPGVGSTFVLDLPRYRPSEESIEALRDRTVRVEASTPEIDTALRRCATAAGVRVVDDAGADVVLVEVEPEADGAGWDRLSALTRRSDDSADHAVVAVGGVMDRSRAVALGATAYLTRPPAPSSLRGAIARAIRRVTGIGAMDRPAPDAPRVLLVGDTFDGLDADSDLLDDGRWALGLVSGVDEAVARALDERPAVVIAAMRTNPRAGIELAERIVSLEPLIRCAVLGVTPLAIDSEVLRWQQAGARRVLARPVTRMSLCAAVAEVLGVG